MPHDIAPVQQYGAASAAWEKKAWPVTIAAAPSATFHIFEKKPRREEWFANRPLMRLMSSSMDLILSSEILQSPNRVFK